MNAELPSKTEQRKLPFRPEPYEVDALYRSINRHVFDNELTQPEIELGIISYCWGVCNWENKKQLDDLIDNMSEEQINFLTIKALESSFSRGTFTLLESEIVSKILRKISYQEIENTPK